MKDKKKITLLLFMLVAAVQLFVPAQMIWEQEGLIKNGTVYKFKTAPIDPTDPFRGKYISLRFEENPVKVRDAGDWERGDFAYLYLTTDSDGYAKVTEAKRVKPTTDSDFLVAEVRYVNKRYGDPTITVDYPFSRFYMEESKAYEAEMLHRRMQRDTNYTAYALVSIKDGEAVLQDVLINGTPIREMVKEEQASGEGEKGQQ